MGGRGLRRGGGHKNSRISQDIERMGDRHSSRDKRNATATRAAEHIIGRVGWVNLQDQNEDIRNGCRRGVDG